MENLKTFLSGDGVWQTRSHGRFMEEDHVRTLRPVQSDHRAGAHKAFIVLFIYLFTFGSGKQWGKCGLEDQCGPFQRSVPQG